MDFIRRLAEMLWLDPNSVTDEQTGRDLIVQSLEVVIDRANGAVTAGKPKLEAPPSNKKLDRKGSTDTKSSLEIDAERRAEAAKRR